MSDDAQAFDVAVVGAGIIGLAVARELIMRKPDSRVVVIDKEDEIGAHQTSHNSGVIHAGIYYSPGSLKAKLCVAGARALYEYCEHNRIPHERCGKLIVAVSERELAGLDELEHRGRANGVSGLRMLSGAELGTLEPHVRGLAALHSPETGIVDFHAVAAAIAREITDAGARLELGRELRRVVRGRGGVRLGDDDGEVVAGRAIFCCGAWSDRLAIAAGAAKEPRIVPFRGAYAGLRPERRALVRGLVYPVPDPALPFLGVHLTRTIGGDVLVGPTALMAGARDAYRLGHVRARDLAATLVWPGTWRLARRFWRTGASELGLALSRRALARAAARYVPELRAADLAAGFAGIRAQALASDGRLVDDFVFSETDGALHVRNAPSPGATSAFAIAEMVVDRAAAELG